jgi:hypothetical protein
MQTRAPANAHTRKSLGKHQDRILATVTCAHVWGPLALLEPQEP